MKYLSGANYMTQSPLREAEDFARRISNLLNSTVASKVNLAVTKLPNGTYWISTNLHPTRGDQVTYIPLVHGPYWENAPALGLKIYYKLDLEPRQKRLSASESSVAISSLIEGRRPIIRWEYERSGGIEPGFPSGKSHARQAAHVHVHGVSSEIEHLALNADLSSHPKLSHKLHKFHIPVGGRRFRPSLEDLIEFFLSHGFVSKFHEGGQEMLEKSRNDWLKQQLKAAVGDDIDTAISTLTEIGYQVQKVSES